MNRGMEEKQSVGKRSLIEKLQIKKKESLRLTTVLPEPSC